MWPEFPRWCPITCAPSTTAQHPLLSSRPSRPTRSSPNHPYPQLHVLTLEFEHLPIQKGRRVQTPGKPEHDRYQSSCMSGPPSVTFPLGVWLWHLNEVAFPEQRQESRKAGLGNRKMPRPFWDLLRGQFKSCNRAPQTLWQRTAHTNDFPQVWVIRSWLGLSGGSAPHVPHPPGGPAAQDALLTEQRTKGRQVHLEASFEVLRPRQRKSCWPLQVSTCLVCPQGKHGEWLTAWVQGGWGTESGSISEYATNPQLGGRQGKLCPLFLMELWLGGHFAECGVK